MKIAFARWGALLAAICPAASMGQLPQAPPSEAERGQQIYVICGACHGSLALGEERLGAPSLVGQQEAYLLRQLRNFRAGIRGGKGDDQAREMRLILDTVSSEPDWKAVIAYVQSLPVQQPPSSLRGDIEAGRQIYATCSACHGSSAEGNEALDAPNLRSLPDWYIVDELRKFKTGARGASPDDPPGGRMRAIAATLRSDEDMRAVASFIATLSPFRRATAPQATAPQATAQEVTFPLNTTCPPSFELTDGNACQFRSLYQMYNSPVGFGGLRVALPSLPDGYSPQQIDLGRYLFFDPLLSADHHLSCAHCHRPDRAFTDGRARSMVNKGGDRRRSPRDILLPRSAPSLWNVGFLRRFFWDGRANSLAEQARGPLFAREEMNNSPQQLEHELNNHPAYRRLFAEAFHLQPLEEITYAMVLQSLSAFESTLISLNSRYDRYAHGDDDALTGDEKHGLNIFRGVALGCSQCHTPPLFANDELEVTGVPNAPGLPFDAGAGRLTPSHGLRGAFKTPTLRNIERTAPYMHAGQFATLRDVVRFYDDRPGHAAPKEEHLQTDWRMGLRRPVLSERDIDDVIAFLSTLTDESMMPAIPLRVPSGLPVVGQTHGQ